MPKMICVQCEVGLKIEQSGIYVVEMFNKPPEPYRIWAADLWQCPGCGAETVAGFSSRSIAEHFQPSFAAELERAQKGRVVYEFERVRER